MDSILRKNIENAHNLNSGNISLEVFNYKNIFDLLKKKTEDDPNESFLTFYNDGKFEKKMSYKEFLNSVFYLAEYMQKVGISNGSRVVLFSTNHYNNVIFYFACWTLGAVAVPINVNEEFGRIEYIIGNAGAKYIFTTKEFYNKIKDIKSVEISIFENLNFSGQTFFNFDIGRCATLKDEALIVYTSGTTGNPKGVVLTQFNLLIDSFFISKWHNVNKGDAMMCVLPLHHVNGIVVTLLTPLIAGGKIVLNNKFHTHSFFPIIEKESVKIVSVVPTLLQFLLHSEIDISNYNLNKFSHLICGAGPLTCELARNFEEKFKIKIVHGYGLSETTCYSCFIPFNLSNVEHKKWQNDFGFPSIGTPLQCNEMEIHDEKGKAVNEGDRGEIVIKGLNVMKYYFMNDEANMKAFENGWFHSGDEGFFRFDDKGNKYFFITGRLKELIIRGGVNISPLEIDEVLNSSELIESAIAVGFENDWYGEEIGAFVKLKNGIRESEDIANEILTFCRKKLPFYKSPKVVVFSDFIPVTSTGKYRRNSVKDKFEKYKKIQFNK